MPDRKIVKFFVSYAHADEDQSRQFLDGFKEMTAPSKKYEYMFWQDTNILPGEKWKQEIQQALKACSIGLLLISPNFLGSKFISEHELSKFIGSKAKPLVPVMLKKVNLNRHDLKGLEENQIFRLRVEGAGNFNSYAQCGSHQKYDFVYELFDSVEALLDKTQIRVKSGNA